MDQALNHTLQAVSGGCLLRFPESSKLILSPRRSALGLCLAASQVHTFLCPKAGSCRYSSASCSFLLGRVRWTGLSLEVPHARYLLENQSFRSHFPCPSTPSLWDRVFTFVSSYLLMDPGHPPGWKDISRREEPRHTGGSAVI